VTSWQSDIAGSKKYHIPVLDPLHVTEVRATDLGLDMVGRDIKAAGIRDIVLKDIRYCTVWG
jgi:hypothetical protein